MTGNLDRLWQEVERKQKMNKNVANTEVSPRVVGYQNAALPFMALVAGLFVAFLQLGIEHIAFCKETNTEK